MILYFLNYNNYYNRIVKKEESLSDYLYYQLGPEMNGVSFVPGNGVDTMQLVNRNLEDIGDYLICCPQDSPNEISSRWFILKADRTRSGQYNLTLRRDLAVDFYNKLLTAPTFIEKATLDVDDPMIFNREDMSYNQIKRSETLLQDLSKSAWLVGYYGRDDGEGNTTTLNGTISSSSIVPDLEVSGINSWDYYKYTTNPYYTNTFNQNTYWGGLFTNFNLYFVNSPNLNSTGNARVVFRNSNTIGFSFGIAPEGYTLSTELDKIQIAQNLSNFDAEGILARVLDNWAEYTKVIPSHVAYDLLNLNNKIIKDTITNIYYRIHVSKFPYAGTTSATISQDRYPLAYDYLSSELGSVEGISGNISEDFAGIINFTLSHRIQLRLTELKPLELTYNITASRFHPADAPYDMFAIPFSDGIPIKLPTEETIYTNKQLAFDIIMGIAEKYYNAGWLYDIQLLPYCPISSIIESEGVMSIEDADSRLYSYITDDDLNIQGVIFNSYQTSFTNNIPLEEPIVPSTDSTELKVQSECDMYRLTSPNFNGQFEFSAVRNNGVSFFNVDCTYKPFNPYIHVNPDFALLYGSDFNDARGLVCGGDFSLPIVTDAWATYELQNKNYQNIFDRQIQNMEVNNSLNNTQAGITGALNAVGTGVSAGLLLGPIGGIVGGIASAVGAAADIGFNKSRQREAIDYTKDQFGYQLGNIKALSDSIAKTSAFVFNNKIYPILEYFTCTDTEKQALRDKIKYNGMTVMKIGNIEDYIKNDYTYIKGKLIRLLDLDLNTYVANELADEINKGVFIK